MAGAPSEPLGEDGVEVGAVSRPRSAGQATLASTRSAPGHDLAKAPPDNGVGDVEGNITVACFIGVAGVGVLHSATVWRLAATE